MASNLFNVSVWKQVYSYFSSYTKYEKVNESQILEPLTTIVRLAIISFKTVGTKIAITNNKIYVQSPNIAQGIVRWTYGNNREEVAHLLKPIFRALHLYNPKVQDHYRIIFEFSVKGLKLLKKSYNNSSSTLCHALDLYINIIENSMRSDEFLEHNSCLNLETLKNNLNLSQNTKINLDKLFEKIWTEDEIKLISNMLNLANINELEKKSYISAI